MSDNLVLPLAHELIRTARHAFTVLSLVLAVPCLAVIVLCTKKSTSKYTIHLICIVLIGVLSDIILQLIWDPIFPLPFPCVLRENPLLPYKGGGHFYVEVFVFVASLHAPTFTACFVERQQAVLSPGSRWSLRKSSQNAIECALIGMAAAMSLMLQAVESFPEEENMYREILSRQFPSALLQHMGCFDMRRYRGYVVLSAMGLSFGVVLGATLSFHTFAELRKTKTLSARSKHFQSMMTRILTVQAIVPLGLVVVPLMATAFAVLLQAEGPLPHSIAFLFVAAHSPIHSIVVLTMTPIYRRKLTQIVGKHSNAPSLKIVAKQEPATLS